MKHPILSALFLLLTIGLGSLEGIQARPRPKVCIVDVASKGAVGDGQTLNTRAIQQCIDEVAARKGGGRVTIGAGRWLTGQIELRSNVELWLDSAALLLGSTNPYDYDKGADRIGARHDEDVQQALVVAYGARNIRIAGRGTIDTQGLDLALAIDSLHHTGERLDPNYNQRRHRPGTRPKLIFLGDCQQVSVGGLTLRNSANWGLSCHACTDIRIDSLTIVNRGYWNNDGIDLNDCRQVEVSHCDINAADDGICLKSDDPMGCCSDILVHDCRVCSSASAVKFGTSSYGGFRRITVRDIEVYDTFRSAIALETVDGGVLEDVLVENVRATNVGNPLFIRLGARHPYAGTDSVRTGGICRRVTIRNLKAQVSFSRPDEAYDLRGPEVNYFHNPWPSSIAGLPGQRIEDVRLEDIDIEYPGRATKGMAYHGLYRVREVDEAAQGYPEFSMFGELPSWAFYVRHVDGITFSNVRLRLADRDFRPAFVLDDVSRLALDGIALPEGQSLESQLFRVE